MIKPIFLLIIWILAVIDWKTHEVPNVLVFPAIVIGCYLTGYGWWAVATFLILSVLTYDVELNPYGCLVWGGGDVKLYTLVASFLGIAVVPIFCFSWILMQLYRGIRYDRESLPITPFCLVAVLLFIWI